ncbi:MAG: cupin domain-containing protein [Chthonomonadales bacterium]
MDVVNRDDVEAFVTKDTSVIREILSYRNSAIRRQSLAEAIVPPGGSTHPHYHKAAEEIYYILAGQGRMRVGSEAADVQAGDGIAIPPGSVHQITNTGREDLVFLCCCAPAYEHADTELVEAIPEPR